VTCFTLARKVDPNYKTNRIILLMTIAVLIVRGLFTNDWGGSLVFLLLLGLLFGTFYGMMLKKDRGIRDDLGELMETKFVLLSYIFYLLMYVVLITSTNIDQGTMSLFFAVILVVALYRGWLMFQGPDEGRI